MLRQPGHIRPVGNAGPQLLVRLLCPIIIGGPSPSLLLRRPMNQVQDTSHERSASLIVESQSPLQLFLGGLACLWPHMPECQCQGVRVVDGQRPSCRECSSVGVCSVTKQGDPAPGNKVGKGCAGMIGVRLCVWHGVDNRFNHRVPSLFFESVGKSGNASGNTGITLYKLLRNSTSPGPLHLAL